MFDIGQYEFIAMRDIPAYMRLIVCGTVVARLSLSRSVRIKISHEQNSNGTQNQPFIHEDPVAGKRCGYGP